MRKKRGLFSGSYWLFSIAAIFIFFLLALFLIHPFLSPTKRLRNTKVLVVEGWIPDYARQAAVEEFNSYGYNHILTTGGPLVTDYRAYMGGILHFSIPDSLQEKAAHFPLQIEAYGSDVGGITAHFSLWVNDSVYIGETFTTDQLTNYRFPLDSCLSEVETVHIRFDNDKMTRTQDRDLFLRDIIVGGIRIKYNSGSMLYEQHWPEEIKNILILPTYAENARADLIRLGVDSTKITAVPTHPVKTHKTFQAATALKKYLRKEQITSFNLLSVGVHTRRSWLTYEKALGENFSIGIISIENKTYNSSDWWYKLVTPGVLRETAKYLYIRFWYDPPVEI